MNIDMTNTPLLHALCQYRDRDPVRFHMPGHHGKVQKELSGLIEDHLYGMDVTEIPGLDDFHAPRGAIKEAQKKLAELYGADDSFLLVNGATSGIVAMMGAALRPGDKVIISRGSHRAVMSGIIYTGANPVYTVPEIEPLLRVQTPVGPEDFESVVRKHPDVKAAVLPHISYQGFCPDLGAISEVTQDMGIPLFVDEAHGPHLAFSPRLPQSAGDFPVRGWVQSPHKVLTSLTQSAWLHIRGGEDLSRRVRTHLAITTTTSPSYILMASLDIAREYMQRFGRTQVERVLDLAIYARTGINEHTPFYCVGDEVKGSGGICDVDMSRLMVHVSKVGYTGFQVESILRRRHDIYAEYADCDNIYFLLGFSTTKEDLSKLVQALSEFGEEKGDPMPILPLDRLPEVAMRPREAYFSPGEPVALEASAGRIAKDALVPYPPGIPLLQPGEIIEQDHIRSLREHLTIGGTCQGIGGDGIIHVVGK